MKVRVVCICIAVLLVAGCYGRGLSPVQITGEQQADVAVREFLNASTLLAATFGYRLQVEPIFADDEFGGNTAGKKGNRARTALADPNSDLLGGQLRADIPYRVTLRGLVFDIAARPDLRTAPNRVRYYLDTGLAASRILCRNYLSGLRDRNEYFEFLQSQLRVVGTLVDLTMTLTEPNNTIRSSVETGTKAVHGFIDNYQQFRFLTPDIETVLPVVESAQVTIHEHFVKTANLPQTFAGAIDAVSRIEYQCTRSGVRALVNKTLIAVPEFGVLNGGILVVKKK